MSTDIQKHHLVIQHIERDLKIQQSFHKWLQLISLLMMESIPNLKITENIE